MPNLPLEQAFPFSNVPLIGISTDSHPDHTVRKKMDILLAGMRVNQQSPNLSPIVWTGKIFGI